MKKLTAIMLCIAIIIYLCSVSSLAKNDIVAFGKCGKTENDNVNWTLSNYGELVISGSGAMADYDYSSCKTVPWANILDEIWCVTIKEGITHIGDYFFYGSDNSRITTYRISNSVVDIGRHFAKPFGSTGHEKTAIIYSGSEVEWKNVENNTVDDSFIVFYNNDTPNPFIEFEESEIPFSHGAVKTLFFNSYLGSYNKAKFVFESSDGFNVLSSTDYSVTVENNGIKSGTLNSKIVDTDGNTIYSDSIELKLNFGTIITYPLEVISGLPYYGLYFFIIGIPMVVYEVYDKVFWWR